MTQRAELLVEILQHELQPKGIVLRGDKQTTQLEGIELAADRHWGKLPLRQSPFAKTTWPLKSISSEGQKTGFYLDQRENRVAAARYFAANACSICSATPAALP